MGFGLGSLGLAIGGGLLGAFGGRREQSFETISQSPFIQRQLQRGEYLYSRALSDPNLLPGLSNPEFMALYGQQSRGIESQYGESGRRLEDRLASQGQSASGFGQSLRSQVDFGRVGALSGLRAQLLADEAQNRFRNAMNLYGNVLSPMQQGLFSQGATSKTQVIGGGTVDQGPSGLSQFGGTLGQLGLLMGLSGKTGGGSPTPTVPNDYSMTPSQLYALLTQGGY